MIKCKRNVNIDGGTPLQAELRFPTRFEGIIDGIRYYITIALRYAQKESRVGIIQLGLKRRLPTLPPK